MSKHSLISPSNLFRIIGKTPCHKSVRAQENLPDQSSQAAKEGTRLHALAENELNTGVRSGNPIIEEYADYVRTMASQDDEPIILVEKRLSLEEWIPNGFGTVDAIVYHPSSRTLHVIDLKTGQNPINATSNPQLMAYALGALDSLNLRVNSFVLHIAQPNNYNSWTVSKEDLYDFGEEVISAVYLALEDTGVYNPTEDNCRYCKAASSCPALHQMSVATVGGDFEKLPAFNTMTDAQILMVIENKKLIESWMKSVYASTLSSALAGMPIAGTKAIAGNLRRYWREDAAATLAHIPEAFEQKLIGITAADKLLSKEFVEGLTLKKADSPRLVLDSHKSPAISLGDDFAVLKLN